MSLHAMVETFKLRIPARAKLLLLALAEIGGDDGEISAYTRDQRFLAWLCGWDDTSNVRRILTWLEDHGLIEIHSGTRGEVSSYRLTYLERLPPGALSRVYKAGLAGVDVDEASGVRNGTPPAARKITPPTVRNGTPNKTPTYLPTYSLQEKPSRARGLRKWFDEELWPRFPDQVDRLNTWHEVEILNPGEALRVEIIAGLDRAIARQEREASEAVDGFVRALPTPRNWLRGRRWEDAA